MEQLLTIDDTAEALRVSTDTVRRIIAREELKSKKVGGQIRIRQLWLDKYLDGDQTKKRFRK